MGAQTTTPASILVPAITPIAYDFETGIITFPDTVNMTTANVFDTTCVVVDNVNAVGYEIILVIDDQHVQIESGIKSLNLNGMTIQALSTSRINTRRFLWFYENVEVVGFASEATETIYLYNIILLILQRYKLLLLDRRNFAISTLNYGALERATPQGDPNILYQRSVSVRGRVQQDVIECTKEQILGIDLEILINNAPTPAGFSTVDQAWYGSGTLPANITNGI
jgi:hypothetical protein